MNRRMRRCDDGASLVLVLVTLVVFGLLVPVLGQFGSVNGVSGYVIKGQRFDRYAADSGMQAAIAWAQSRRAVGREYGPCADVTTHLDGTTAATARDVTVSCVGYGGSGQPIGDADTPAYAVLALTAGSHGVDITSSGGMKTSGAWWADGNPGQTSADLHRVNVDASDDLFGATGGCDPADGAVLNAAPQRCNSGVVVADPAYPMTLAANLAGLHADPALDPASYCASIGSNGVVRLAQGIHWDAAWLNALTDGSTCHRDVVIWLEPGVHYFDFDFYDRGRSNAAANAWTIGGSSSHSVTVVGGAATGWNPYVGGGQAAAAEAAVPTDNAATGAGACNTGSLGVELTLGSQSQIDIQPRARVELCPYHPLTETGMQHLAVYGPKTGDTGAATAFPASSPRDARPSVSRGRFDWPAALPVPNPLVAHDCSGNNNCPGSIGGTVEGSRATGTVTMNVPNTLPQDQRLESLTLSIWHREPQTGFGGSNNITNMTLALAGVPGMAPCSRSVTPTNQWTQAPLTCNLAGVTTPMPDPATLRDLQATLSLTTRRRNGNPNDNVSATVQLDQVQLTGTATRLVVRGERGCVTSHSCAALAVDNGGGGASAAAFLWGTAYLPVADVDLDFGGQTRFRLARGVVTHQLTIRNLPASAGFAPISLPHGGIYTDRTVEFAAKVGDDSDPTLTARVVFPDSQCLSDILPTPCPGEPAQIRAWQPKK